MPSSYSSNLKIELQATGENSGTWGTITNTNLGTALEQAIVGYGNPSYASDANLTLTYTDTNAAQAARALVLNVTSAVSLTGTRELVVPTIQKQYIVQNNTTGSQSITVKTSAGTGITVPNGRKAHLYVDGTNVIFMDDFVDINGGSIDGTTIGANSAAAGNFTTVDTTNIEVTNLKAKDGTTAGSIADATGVVTLGSSVLTTTDINGGTIDGTTIGGSSAAAGTFTTLTTSSTVTLNGGTANGVLYLNGSKVATSGSALTFNGTEIGTTSTGLNINNANALVRYQNGSGTRTGYLQVRADAFDIWSDQAAVPMVFGVANSEAMRLNSTGLGIGTSSPTHKLQTNGSGRFGTMTTGPGLLSGSSDTFQVGLNQDNTNTTNTQVWAEYVNGATSASWAVRYRAANDTGTASTRLFLDAASGNLGIGTASPSSRLEVLNGGDSIVTITGNTASGNFASVDFKRNTGTVNAAVRSQSVGGNDIGEMYFMTRPNAGSLTERMRLTSSVLSTDSSINVGIGTSSPAVKLDVAGASTTQMRVQMSGQADVRLLSDTGTGVTGTYSNHPFTIKTNSADVMSLTAAGNVGIGTSSPDTKLTVAGNAKVSSNSGTTFVQVDDTSTGGRLYSLISAGAGNVHSVAAGTFYLRDSTNGENRLLIDGSGNLGLGVTPVASFAGYKTFQIASQGVISSDSTSNGELEINNNAYRAVTTAAHTYINSFAATRYSQYQGAHTWFTAPSGTAGNTITFTETLRSDTAGTLTINTQSGNNTNIAFSQAGSLKWYIGNVNSDNAFRFYDNTAGSERARITSGGTLLVNTTTAAANALFEVSSNGTKKSFQVYNNDNVQLYSLGTGTVYSNGGVLTNTNPSDERLKDDIADLPYGLDQVLALRPVSYKWKNDRVNQGTQYGFIAQEVQPIMPELVREFDTVEDEESVKRYGLEKDGIYAALVKAVQEQQTMINELKAKVAALETK